MILIFIRIEFIYVVYQTRTFALPVITFAIPVTLPVPVQSAAGTGTVDPLFLALFNYHFTLCTPLISLFSSFLTTTNSQKPPPLQTSRAASSRRDGGGEMTPMTTKTSMGRQGAEIVLVDCRRRQSPGRGIEATMALHLQCVIGVHCQGG